MKQLRILTGRHAGARLRLTRQQNTLGSDPEADVHITDWKHSSVSLAVEEGMDVVRLCAPGAHGGAMRETLLEDFVPRRFDDIVLCIGPADDTAWPSEVDLLAKLLRKKRTRTEKPAPQRSRGAAMAGGLACTLLLGGFAALLANGTNKAEARTPLPPLQVRVAGALARAGLDGLSVREAGRRVVVEGLVDTPADVARTRALLNPFGDTGVVHRYASATSLAQSISDALADSALHVRYQRNGVFVVEGRAVETDRLRDAVQRIARDLGPMVRRIDFAVTELPPPQRAHVDAMLVSPGVRYVQTRDGTKHLIVSSTETGELGSVSDSSTPQ